MLNIVNTAELQFEFLKEIGAEGKNSQVFIAKDKQLDAELVVKKIRKDAIASAAEYFRESTILHKTEHPNVVPVYYGCQDKDHIYIAMPYLSQGSLNALMHKRFLTVREIIRYGIQFLSGLHNIHAKGLIHFDIKPDNILLTQSGEAVVSDFGLAKHMSAAGQANPVGFYTKIAPPELVRGDKDFDLRYDIYQAGCTLYRMCVGNEEYYKQFAIFETPGGLKADEFVAAILNEKFPDRTKFPAHIPKALQKIVLTCLKTDKDKRYASVLEITNALAKLECHELDWQYSVDANGKQKWEHTTEGRKLYLEIDMKGVADAAKAGASGKFTKVKEFCGVIIPKKISEFFKEAK